MRKCSKTNVDMSSEVLVHLDNHPVEFIYTDGSKTDQHQGFVAVFQNNAYTGKTPREIIHLCSQNVCNEECLDQKFGY